MHPQRKMIGYHQYISNEIKLLYHTTAEFVKFYEELGFDTKYPRAGALVCIADLKSREFLIYFMQHQERLEKEQIDKMKELNII